MYVCMYDMYDMYACMHMYVWGGVLSTYAYIHDTYVRTYIHTYIHTYIIHNIHTYQYIHTSMLFSQAKCVGWDPPLPLGTDLTSRCM